MINLPLQKIFLLSLCLVTLSGCAHHGYSSNNSSTEYIRDTQGQTVARIRDGNVYNTQGIRTHRIDSQGMIYSVQGKTAGQRVGKIGK